ncbi:MULTISPECIES: GHMP kinase [unclassified Nocardiopsis]|uniref:GHMP family kinase ATP-binding protein n=1 Tax=unclassified Nocardiopsis TaxID=2649073 RepID=UPI00191523DA|nr:MULTISPECIES: GHMP kinase [unclassified Nocardiopsis]
MRISEDETTSGTASPKAFRALRSASRTAGMGFGSSRAHHGEILQGVFEHQGRLLRGLVTMPCDLYRSYVVFEPSRTPVLTVTPPDRAKAFRAAAETLSALGRSHTGGNLYLESDVPLSRGFGSSTTDVIATILAVQDACGQSPDSAVTARLAVRAEQASDSLMFGERSVLFAQRDGVLIEEFAAPLPPLAALGFGTSRDGAGVSTLDMRPAVYDRAEVAEFADLRARLREAVAAGDPAGIAEVASASGRINQRHLPVPGFADLEALAARCGALGLQVAHSGDIAGLLFDGRDPDVDRARGRAERGLRDLGVKDTWRFSADGRKKDSP